VFVNLRYYLFFLSQLHYMYACLEDSTNLEQGKRVSNNSSKKEFRSLRSNYLATPRYLETPLENPLLFLRINFMDLIIWLTIYTPIDDRQKWSLNLTCMCSNQQIKELCMYI
jgi:hypothetical protein